MTIKKLLRKQIIVLMNISNTKNIINSANIHISNISKSFREIKLDNVTNFIYITSNGIIIITNKPALNSDMNTIEKYLKICKFIKLDFFESPHFSKSKSFMKILGLSYILENTNLPITSELIKEIIKEIHIFNNITLSLKPYIIKVSSKFNMAVILIDI